ncbi:MAG TPA: hypothetical protein VHA10_01445 [Hypericibacter adhaerens]|uniref:Lipoprotein n=1 Tax=Hypericibacter adhaerens TaxID=2602016 RepID=A0A5J6MT73_9PROT|nr:hypothetical protein [Hypericibacter adhaerens]QEX20327.1 hypothetical protein FRZ61_02440 [Hypericibacter adhaerens]HWA41845.1 hypothetical protein [Hypericibacter adhaerens]
MSPASWAKARMAGLLLSASLLAPLALSACDRYGDDIALVKKSPVLGDTTGEKLCTDTAGARGKFEWSAGKSETYKDNDQIVEVTCKVTKPGSSGAQHVIEFAFIHNRQTEKVALDRLLIDGKEQSLLSGAMNLMLLQLD